MTALEVFFASLPPVSAAFVIVQHLAPEHACFLADLLGRMTPLPVAEVEDGTAVRPNHVYVIPPNRNLSLERGVLRLVEPAEARGSRLPIDYFFRSLAADQREHAICVVLSGTGADGTLGVQAVKAAGGMAMAQEPGTAEHPGMPLSAIKTGLVDYVMPVDQLPVTLAGYLGERYGTWPEPSEPAQPDSPEALRQIFDLVGARTGHDFSAYKPNTVARRLERRMAVNRITRLRDYLRVLHSDPGEVDSLFRDFLIGVTSFFRDPEAFANLEQVVLPALIPARSGSPESVRIWVPGCSTGEEAYSLAMLFQEWAESAGQNPRIQIFASDLDPAAIATARAGVYPASIAANVSRERLARHFSFEAGLDVYRIRKNVRDLIVFSEQDLIRDPPFSRVDLISCRNLLIYLNADLQRRIIPLFHYSLRTAGYLILGASETVGEFQDLFSAVNQKWRIYQKKETAPGIQSLRRNAFQPRADWNAGLAAPLTVKTQSPARTPIDRLVEKTLLEEYAPAGVLVTDRGEILYCHGRTGLFLEPSPGEAGMNVLRMAREGLRQPLTVALRGAKVANRRIDQPGVRVKTNGHHTAVDLSVLPLETAPGASGPGLFLVILGPARGSMEQEGTEPAKDTQQEAGYLSGLKRELLAKEEYLQAANEELETANEELRSYNEEMQSINEELQSTNEELETSKEELQSINEEFATVNAELSEKIVELKRVNNDMTNLLAGTGIGTVFVDHQLRILRFTPAITQVVNLIPSDVGRPVGHIVSNLAGYDRLVEDAQLTLDSLVPVETEVTSKTGQVYLLRIRPYRTQDNVIEGAVITFVDISEVKRVQNAYRESDAKCRVLFESMPQGVLFYDSEGLLTSANPAAERILGSLVNDMRAHATRPKAIHPDGTAFPWESGPVMSALKTGRGAEGVEMGLSSSRGGPPVWVRVSSQAIFKPGADRAFQVYTTLTGIEDP